MMDVLMFAGAGLPAGAMVGRGHTTVAVKVSRERRTIDFLNSQRKEDFTRFSANRPPGTLFFFGVLVLCQ